MKNCWEIRGCGREKGGAKVEELGECIASIESMGHSCWAIAGTLCGGVVQGNVKDKEKNCLVCEVFGLYNRQTGTCADAIAQTFPREEEKYRYRVLHR